MWLEKNLPTEFSKLVVKGSAESTGGTGAGEDDEKKRQKRGGKGMIKPNKKKDPTTDQTKKICVSRAPRGKKKSVTVVTGLNSYGESSLLFISKLIQISFQLNLFRHRPQVSSKVFRLEIRLRLFSNR